MRYLRWKGFPGTVTWFRCDTLTCFLKLSPLLVLFADWTNEIYFCTFTKIYEKFPLALRTIPLIFFHLNLVLFCNRWRIFNRLATSFFPLEHVSVPTGALNTGASTRVLLQKVNFSLNFSRGCLIFHNRQYSFCRNSSTQSCYMLVFVLCPGKFIFKPLFETSKSIGYETQFLFYGSLISVLKWGQCFNAWICFILAIQPFFRV